MKNEHDHMRYGKIKAVLIVPKFMWDSSIFKEKPFMQFIPRYVMKHPNPISSNNCPLRNLILHVRELVQGPAGCVKKMITDTAQLIVIIFSNTVYFY